MTLSPNKSEVLYICLTFDFESTQGKDKKSGYLLEKNCKLLL